MPPSLAPPADRQGSNIDSNIQKCVNCLEANSIRAVVFDMDQTAVAMHSRGNLLRIDAERFFESATLDFRRLVPELHRRGFHLSIATHSDEEDFTKGRIANEVNPETHIMGTELAAELVEHCFPGEIASSFFIVAYNPRPRGQLDNPLNCMKRYHMREIQQHFSVSSKEIIFFDDVLKIVDDCSNHCGVRSVLVDAKYGFRLTDLMRAFQNDSGHNT